MRLPRGPISSLFPPLVVMAVVSLALLFFYANTPTDLFHNARSWRQSEPRLNQSSPRSSRSQSTVASNIHGGSALEIIQPQAERKMFTGNRSTVPIRQIVLVSLARSGSSFTGDVLSHAPDVYYVFEPLKKAEEVMLEEYRNNTGDEESLEVLAQGWTNVNTAILERFLSCDFHDLDLSLLDYFFLDRSRRTRLLSRCVYQHKKRSRVDSNCLQTSELLCRKTNVRLLKVIRIRVGELEPLMALRPELTVILLVRDPRASTWSRFHVFNESFAHDGDRFSFIQSLCYKLADDLDKAADFHYKFPGRVKVVRYESLAEKPLTTFKHLYNFLDLRWNDHVERLIKQQTKWSFPRMTSNSDQHSKNQDKDDRYTVTRKDSVRAAYAWRSVADWDFVKGVQTVCLDVMEQLGYRMFRRETELRDNGTRTYRSEENFQIPSNLFLN